MGKFSQRSQSRGTEREDVELTASGVWVSAAEHTRLCNVVVFPDPLPPTTNMLEPSPAAFTSWAAGPACKGGR